MSFILKHPSIKGNYSEGENKNCVKIFNLSFSVSRNVDQISGSSKRNIGLPKYEDISFLKLMDISTPSIENEIFCGAINDCELIYIEGGKKKMVISLNNALISLYHVETETISGQTIEHVKLNYTGISIRNVQ